MANLKLVKAGDKKAFRLVWPDTSASVELKGSPDVKSTVDGWVREFKAVSASRNPKRAFDGLFKERAA